MGQTAGEQPQSLPFLLLNPVSKLCTCSGEQLFNYMRKLFIKAVEPILKSLFFNHFSPTSVLPGSWDSNPPVHHPYFLSLMLEYFLAWSAIFHVNLFFTGGCFSLGILSTLHPGSVTREEQFLVCLCQQHQGFHPPTGTELHVNFSVIGSCMMKAALGLRCHFSLPLRAPGKTASPLLFPWPM